MQPGLRLPPRARSRPASRRAHLSGASPTLRARTTVAPMRATLRCLSMARWRSTQPRPQTMRSTRTRRRARPERAVSSGRLAARATFALHTARASEVRASAASSARPAVRMGVRAGPARRARRVRVPGCASAVDRVKPVVTGPAARATRPTRPSAERGRASCVVRPVTRAARTTIAAARTPVRVREGDAELGGFDDDGLGCGRRGP